MTTPCIKSLSVAHDGHITRHRGRTCGPSCTVKERDQRLWWFGHSEPHSAYKYIYIYISIWSQNGGILPRQRPKGKFSFQTHFCIFYCFTNFHVTFMFQGTCAVPGDLLQQPHRWGVGLPPWHSDLGGWQSPRFNMQPKMIHGEKIKSFDFWRSHG